LNPARLAGVSTIRDAPTFREDATMHSDLTRISKFLSLVLRHKPEEMASRWTVRAGRTWRS
jgi:RNA:NAD 2'-phosphotransferase (TPT1/KptA family)